jgi:DNA-binding NarL/FixJ family response regulator
MREEHRPVAASDNSYVVAMDDVNAFSGVCGHESFLNEGGRACKRRPVAAELKRSLPHMMGPTTGAEVCAALHADRRTAAIPVIMLTTLTSEMHIAMARASGCEALLVKPSLPEQLREEAARLIGRSQRAQRLTVGGAVARAR